MILLRFDHDKNRPLLALARMGYQSTSARPEQPEGQTVELPTASLPTDWVSFLRILSQSRQPSEGQHNRKVSHFYNRPKDS